ncbi:hypothetical protein BH23ACT9_BH23ACT9_31400 [soil metagenome]
MHAVRQQLASTSIDAQAARTLAGGADRDVSEVRAELRAHTQVLNALRETQVEQGRVLDQHGVILANHGQTMVHHGRLLDQQSQTLDQQSQTLDQQSQTLDQQSQTLDQHTHSLDQHTHSLDRIIEILTADA